MNVVTTDVYVTWLRKLKQKDPRTAARIQMRVDRLVAGNPGNGEAIGSGLSELRIHHGPGYRVYYKQTEKTILVILCGGDKSTQDRDIKRAKEIAAEL